MELALANGCETMAFLSSSSGVYSYHRDQALNAAMEQILRKQGSDDE